MFLNTSRSLESELFPTRSSDMLMSPSLMKSQCKWFALEKASPIRHPAVGSECQLWIAWNHLNKILNLIRMILLQVGSVDWESWILGLFCEWYVERRKSEEKVKAARSSESHGVIDKRISFGQELSPVSLHRRALNWVLRLPTDDEAWRCASNEIDRRGTR